MNQLYAENEELKQAQAHHDEIQIQQLNQETEVAQPVIKHEII